MLTYADIGSRLALTILSALNSHKKLLGVIGLASVLVSSYAPPVLGQGQFFHSLLESVAASRILPAATNPDIFTEAFGCGSAGATLSANLAPESYTLFESGPVRPIALSPDGQRLAVTNIPANCLEIYSVDNDQFSLEATVMVGMEPVAVAFKDNDEIWVVNHLSDSVSVVTLTGLPRVVETLQVGDEPRDIVFAGKDARRAFITAAFRGQNHPEFSADTLLQPGLGRADVWVMDAASDAAGADRLVTIVNLFSDTPRALAVSPNGERVYAAAFMSGNQTTALSAEVVAGIKPLPTENHQGESEPETALIVQKRESRWVDERETDWTASVMLDLPDKDVFLIDATAALPTVTAEISGVGTTLFNMAVNPISGVVYVSALDALNHVRFEGPGETTTTVRGHIAESSISVLDGGGAAVLKNHLNPHIDFEVPEKTAYSADLVASTLSQPTALTVDPSGTWLYVAALGSEKIARIPVSQLEQGLYQPNANNHFEVPGGGPSGLALTAAGDRLFVYSRFSNSLSLLDTADGRVLANVNLFSPESDGIIAGRKFLYDGRESSANGTSACSSCHIYGDMDQLAWDLGNPDGDLLPNRNRYVSNSPRTTLEFHPMKGPMTTQTLRGIADSGPQHWRGDRMGRNRETVNGVLESLEAAAFKEFNPAFVELLGRTEELSGPQMQAFTDFALALTPPPNPIRRLDNSLTDSQANGLDIYFTVNDITGLGSCNHCHTLEPEANKFGTGGLMTFEGAGVDENFKVPHFRNAYAKVGMFGTSGRLNQNGHAGDQIKGFGYLHDGSTASLTDFFASPTFVFPEPRAQTESDVINFVMAADSNLAPVVGQQVTITSRSSAADIQRLALLEARAVIDEPRPECDLMARGVLESQRISVLMTATGDYFDANGVKYFSEALLAQARSSDNALTYTCLPPNNGSRIALDTP